MLVSPVKNPLSELPMSAGPRSNVASISVPPSVSTFLTSPEIDPCVVLAASKSAVNATSAVKGPASLSSVEVEKA